LPPQPLCLFSLPTSPRASSLSLYSRLSLPSARHLPLVRPKRSRRATIPFRITFFAHPHHLTLIESYSYKNRGRGWGHYLPARSPNAFLHLAAVNSIRIRIYEKSASNPFRMRSFKTQDLNPLESAFTKNRESGVLLLSTNPIKDFCPELPSGARDPSDRPTSVFYCQELWHWHGRVYQPLDRRISRWPPVGYRQQLLARRML
jgi:hypothetical protein